MSRPAVSVAIGAQDEEDRLPRTLESLGWADEILVVDSGSSDRTADVARELGARVHSTADWPGEGAQRRQALDLASGPWILLVDADEVVTPGLAAEILELVGGNPAHQGYEVLRHTYDLGHWFGRRGWHRERVLRLVLKEAATVTDHRVHSRLEVDGTVGRLASPMLHYTNRDLAHYLDKMQMYSSVKAQRLYEQGRRAGIPSAIGHAAARFVSGYIGRGGFLDGWPGLANDLLGAHSTLLAYLKLRELRSSARPPGG